MSQNVFITDNHVVYRVKDGVSAMLSIQPHQFDHVYGRAWTQPSWVRDVFMEHDKTSFVPLVYGYGQTATSWPQILEQVMEKLKSDKYFLMQSTLGRRPTYSDYRGSPVFVTVDTLVPEMPEPGMARRECDVNFRITARRPEDRVVVAGYRLILTLQQIPPNLEPRNPNHFGYDHTSADSGSLDRSEAPLAQSQQPATADGRTNEASASTQAQSQTPSSSRARRQPHQG